MNKHFNSPKNQLRNKAMKRPVALVFALATLMTPVTISTVTANDVVAEIRHTLMCAGLLINDPERHLVECGVGDTSRGPLPKRSAGTPVVEPEQEPETDSESEPS